MNPARLCRFSETALTCTGPGEFCNLALCETDGQAGDVSRIDILDVAAQDVMEPPLRECRIKSVNSINLSLGGFNQFRGYCGLQGDQILLRNLHESSALAVKIDDDEDEHYNQQGEDVRGD